MTRVNHYHDDTSDDIWENGQFLTYGEDCAKKILYEERRGSIYWAHKRKLPELCREFVSYGQVPQEVQREGLPAIQSYVEQKINEDFSKKESAAREDHRFYNNPEYPLEASYDGVQLKGCIEYTNGSELRVKLESPFIGTDLIFFGYASHLRGRHILKRDPDGRLAFTEEAIKTALQLLVNAYKKKRHEHEQRPLLDLVSELNKTTR